MWHNYFSTRGGCRGRTPRQTRISPPVEISRGGELSSFSLPCGVPVTQPQNHFSSPFPQACFEALGRLLFCPLLPWPWPCFSPCLRLFHFASLHRPFHRRDSPAGASAYSTSSFLSQASLILQFYLASELREPVNERDRLLCLRFWASSEGAVE